MEPSWEHLTMRRRGEFETGPNAQREFLNFNQRRLINPANGQTEEIQASSLVHAFAYHFYLEFFAPNQQLSLADIGGSS